MGERRVDLGDLDRADVTARRGLADAAVDGDVVRSAHPAPVFRCGARNR